MAGYTIREATKDDKEAVIKLHEGELDYLPASYDYFLQATHILPVVMVYQKHIIAFEIGELVDNGETIVPRAGRVHPDYEGRKVVKQPSQYLVDWGKAKGARAAVITVFDSNKVYLKPSFQKVTKLLCTRIYTSFDLSLQKMEEMDHSQLNKMYDGVLQEISDLNLKEHFRSSDISKYLAPQGRLILNQVPFQLYPSNVPIMRGSEVRTHIYSDVRLNDAGRCGGLLSFGTHFKVKEPYFKYVLDLFGTDFQSLEKHLLAHLNNLRTKTVSPTVVLIFVSEHFDLQTLSVISEKYDLERTGTLKFSRLFLYGGLDDRTASRI